MLDTYPNLWSGKYPEMDDNIATACLLDCLFQSQYMVCKHLETDK